MTVEPKDAPHDTSVNARGCPQRPSLNAGSVYESPNGIVKGKVPDPAAWPAPDAPDLPV
jgi:hypothetical protein